MRISDKLKFTIKWPYSLICSAIYQRPAVMSNEQTVKYILEHDCSVVRFGDGEFNLMNGIGIKFQKSDDGLRARLKEITAAQSADKLLICIPNMFVPKKQLAEMLTDESVSWWRKNLFLTRGLWYKSFSGGLYGSTNMTRFYIRARHKERTAGYVRELIKVWENRDIVFIEGSKTHMGAGNDLFKGAKSIKRILCPPEDAFARYDEILAAAQKHIGKDELVICALGPAATVLCYDLFKLGYTALDLGHMDIEYEWFKMGATRKVAIKGKAVNEAPDSDPDTTIFSEEDVLAEIG
ncbi:MAG: GT-D fold domain-containing glycosyltransferase [Pseudonocardiaceae bacterium]